MNFKVSVIIPVFNVELYLEEAIRSAVTLEEVFEVILVEDGSVDKSFEICNYWAKKHSKVKLVFHKNHQNKGVALSRNLGVESATYDFISFLDADDWYLENRFSVEKAIFDSNPEADGVYGGTGFFYQVTKSFDRERLTTIDKIVKPKDLIYTLLDGKGGRFTTNAITFKKSFFLALGGFDKTLELGEDTDLWIRASVRGKLYSGLIGYPVAIRRVHDFNSSKRINHLTDRFLYEKLYKYFLHRKGISNKAFLIIFKRYIGTRSNSILSRYYNAIFEIICNPICIRKLV
ncbi:glycosyltransferase family 2 protein [Cyclobacterium plantarum]|uniref:Glycosyltransferase family 2 protein n=1 Tax=Cyclobacterium plantarum TaxID=2716263 RepID=A0ABX0H7Q9_9BACT|nr:glycosyltransferase family 2 protein [Cyclobacterium plantarum]NHE56242.1 glycosyltransferase family 2 protein [Cyclobacterium plantarum]